MLILNLWRFWGVVRPKKINSPTRAAVNGPVTHKLKQNWSNDLVVGGYLRYYTYKDTKSYIGR